MDHNQEALKQQQSWTVTNVKTNTNTAGLFIVRSLSLRARTYPIFLSQRFHRIDLFLVSIYRELRLPQEPQWPITSTRANLAYFIISFLLCRQVALGRHFLSLPMCPRVDWNWPISREKKPDNRSAFVWELHAPSDELLLLFIYLFNYLILFIYFLFIYYAALKLVICLILVCRWRALICCTFNFQLIL